MSLSLTLEQKKRYLTDAEFHARVEVVARALWASVIRFEYGFRDPYPYDRLIPETQGDLVAYAIAAVEALEAFEGNGTREPLPAVDTGLTNSDFGI